MTGRFLLDIISKLGKRHSTNAWYRVEIDFPGELDEAFGVAADKQGVRMKAFVMMPIKKAIGDDLVSIKRDIEEVQAQQGRREEGQGAEPLRNDGIEADAFQADQLDVSLANLSDRPEGAN